MPSIRTSTSEGRKGRRLNSGHQYSLRDREIAKISTLQNLQDHKPVLNMSLLNIEGNHYEGDVTIAGDLGYPGFDALFQQASHAAAFDLAVRYSAGKCHPGTRETVISAIRDWIHDPVPEYDILWLNGSAGAGKSSIAQTIASIINDEEDKILAGSFFFSRGVVGREEASSLFPTLAYQIGVSMQGMRKQIDDAMKVDYSIPKKSIDKHFPHLIVEPLLKSTFDFTKWHRPTIVIDGLDECQDHKMQLEILSLIGKACVEFDIPVRFLITSRPENWIRNAFESDPLRRITNVMTLGSDEEADEDIRKYFLHRFDEIYSEKQDLMHMLKVQRPWPSAEVVGKLVKNASGQFIYASTLCKFLEPRFSNPVKELRKVMDRNFPLVSAFSDLDNLYVHILSQFPPQKNQVLRNILAGIVVDLPLRGVQTILNVEYDQIFFAIDALKSVLFVPDGLDGYVVDDKGLETTFGPPDQLGAAKFCHASFRDFLLNPGRSGHFSIDIVKYRQQIVRNYFEILVNALRGKYSDTKHPDISFPMYIGILSASFESCVGNREEWYPPAVLIPFLKKLRLQLTSMRARDLAGIRQPIKLLHYLQNATEFLQDRQVDTHFDWEIMSMIGSALNDLTDFVFEVVQYVLPRHYSHLLSTGSPLLHLNVAKPNILLTLEGLSGMFNTTSAAMAKQLINLQHLISCRHVVGYPRHYCLSLLALISRALSDQQLMDNDDDDPCNEYRLLNIRSVSQVLASIPNLHHGDSNDSPFDDSTTIIRDKLSSFYDEASLSDIKSGDLQNKDFISVLNLTLGIPNRDRNTWLNFEISASIMAWTNRQCECAATMQLLEKFDPELPLKMRGLSMQIYEEIILPVLVNPYTSELRMISTKKGKTIMLNVVSTNGTEHRIVEEESFIPAGTIIPPSFELCTDDYEIIMSSLPETIHTHVWTRFVEFILNMWAKDVYCQSHPGFREYAWIRDSLNFPCFDDALDGLVDATDGILTTLRGIRCLVPDGKTKVPVDAVEKLSSLIQMYSGSKVSEEKIEDFLTWLKAMEDFSFQNDDE